MLYPRIVVFTLTFVIQSDMVSQQLWANLVVEPRTSLERLLNRVTAFPYPSEGSSEQLHSYLIIRYFQLHLLLGVTTTKKSYAEKVLTEKVKTSNLRPILT